MLPIRRQYHSAYVGWVCSLIFALAVQHPLGAPLPHDVYVWQRKWTPSLRNAIQEHGPAFSQVVLLAAEVTWRDGKPELFRVPTDYEGLKRGNRPVGVALRVGPYSGSFAPSDFIAGYLADLAEQILTEVRAQGLSLSELQLDFDCASSRLAGYRLWVETIRRGLIPCRW